VIRKIKKSDIGFVVDTWHKSAKKLHMSRFVDQKAYNLGHGKIITSLLDHDDFIIACDHEDEDVIWGYVAFDPDVQIVDYVYVKEVMRGHGIARNLIDATGLSGKIRVTHRPNTQGKDELVKKFKSRFTYDLYSAFRVLTKESGED
jgi:GNAT superfamily N-acetyltransferase